MSVSGTWYLVLFAAGHEMALVLAGSVLELVLVLEGCIVGVEVGTAVEESVMSTLLKTECKFLKQESMATSITRTLLYQSQPFPLAMDSFCAAQAQGQHLGLRLL